MHIVETVGIIQAHMGNHRVIAFALMPQGVMTAPNGVVAYEMEGNDITPFVVHYVNFETRGLLSGTYVGTADEAWLEFLRRMNLHAHYVEGGTPLTGEDQNAEAN